MTCYSLKIVHFLEYHLDSMYVVVLLVMYTRHFLLIQSTNQCVFAGEMHKPSFFHNIAAFPLGVFDRLNHPH